MVKLFGNSEFSGFADRKQLAEDKTPFCIESAKLTTQKDGKTRWYLTIFAKTGEDDLEVKTLTFDQTSSRDATFNELNARGGLPLHSCTLEKREFKGKSGMMQTFYDIEHDNKAMACPCGDLQKPQDAPPPEESNVPDYIPF